MYSTILLIVGSKRKLIKIVKHPQTGSESSYITSQWAERKIQLL